jgi:hypothetical protein
MRWIIPVKKISTLLKDVGYVTKIVSIYVDIRYLIDLTSTPIPHATMMIAGVLLVMRIQ